MWRTTGIIITLLALTTAIFAVARDARAAATQRFTSANVSLLDAAGGQPAGTVTPGTPVTVTEEQQGNAHVQITGWSAEGADSIVVTAPAVRIVLISGFTAGKAGRAVLSSQDAAGSTWHQVRIDGWLPSSSLADDDTKVWAAARDLFNQRCSSCHALPGPSQNPANAWPGVVAGMAQNAGLTPDQTTLISKYLQLEASKAPS